MALDNAEFIAELSITDPPGTDPLNQGDDHIRTTKKAVQQSFPNVGSAVPQTGQQMAQMAIKNEVNVFTQTNTFQVAQNFADRNFVFALNNTFPGFTYFDINSDRHFELYVDTRVGQGVAWDRYDPPGTFVDTPLKMDRANGRLTLRNIAFFDGGFRVLDGTAATPAMAFSDQAGTGLYRSGTNISFAIDGATAAFLLPAQMRMFQDGQAAAPAYGFQNNTNMGMYRAASNVLAFATAGVQRITVTGSEFQVFTPFRAVPGTDALGAYSFQSAPDTGMSRGTGGALNFAVAADRMLSLKTSGEITLKVKLWHAGGTPGDLFFDQSQNFVTTDFIVGIYQ